MRPIEIVRRVAPNARAAYLSAFENGDALLKAHGITTPLRLAHLLAQVMHESGGLTIEWENLSYKTASRLMEIFGQGKHSAAVTWGEVGGLLGNPQKLAERVYGLGNPKKAQELGNKQTGDGYRYRGGGILQTTGRSNYRRMGEKCGVDFDAKPELVVSAEHALKPALTEWSEGNLNAAADRDDILTITKRINGGTNGLADRRAWLAKLKKIITSVDLAPQSAAPAHPAQPEQNAMPPWLDRMTAILGLYEAPGSADNPLILEMAKVCGGQIAKTYNHDSIAWCALTANYCLVGSGFRGNDSLWALDFGNYGRKLSGSAVGAIATKKRYEGGKQVGGHVFLVVGKTKSGMIVGRGGNQSDMVCDELFDPDIITGYNWPADYPPPAAIGLLALPVVTPAPKTKRQLAALPPPVSRDDQPGTSVPTPQTPTGEPPGAASEPPGAASEPPLRGDPLIWRVQRILGFTGDDLDGEFGAKTEAAVRQFQRANGLEVDGEVGPDTWAALDRYEAELMHTAPKSPDPAPAKTTSPQSAPSGLFSWLGRLFGRKG